MSARTLAIASISVLVLFAVLMHWPVFLQGKTVSAFDFSYFAMDAYKAARPAAIEHPSNRLLSDPVLMYQVWDRVRYDGTVGFPWLWNPYTGCGSPLLANAESTPFFPLKTLTYALGGPARGFGFLCFLKMLLAGLLMWAYLRRLGAGYPARTIGAIAFMASGFMIAWLQWAHTNVALTLPLLLLGCEHLVHRNLKRGFLFISIAIALGLLGGHPETSLHISFAAAVYTAVRLLFPETTSRETRGPSPRARLTAFGMLCAAGAFGALIAAVQVVPTLEYIGLSARLEARTAESAARDHPSLFARPDFRHARDEFISYLMPNAYGNPSLHSHWWKKGSNFNESAGYIGVGAVLMALFAWRWLLRDRRILSLCILQLVSLGFVFDVPQITATLGRLPLLDIAANKRFLLVWCFSAAASGALALDRLFSAKRITRTDVVWLALIGLLFACLVTYDFTRRFARHPVPWIRASGRGQVLHFALCLVPWFAVLFLSRLPEKGRAGLALALTAVLAADLYLAHFGYNPFIHPDHIYPRTAAVEFLQDEKAPVRILPIDTHIGPNIPAVYRLQDSRLYDAQVYRPYHRFMTRLGSHSGWHIVKDPDPTLCSVAAIRYIWAGPEWSPGEWTALEVCYEDETSVIYENGDALPHVYVSRRWRTAASPDEALDILAQDDFPWQSTVVIEPGKAEDIERPPTADPVPVAAATITQYRPHSVTVKLPDAARGLLVLNDCYYPGWEAWVGGEKRPIYRVNGTFRSVFVSPADHEVVFKYNPPSFRYGAALSIAGVIAFLLVLLGLPRRIRLVFSAKEQQAR